MAQWSEFRPRLLRVRRANRRHNVRLAARHHTRNGEQKASARNSSDHSHIRHIMEQKRTTAEAAHFVARRLVIKSQPACTGCRKYYFIVRRVPSTAFSNVRRTVSARRETTSFNLRVLIRRTLHRSNNFDKYTFIRSWHTLKASLRDIYRCKVLEGLCSMYWCEWSANVERLKL